VEVVDDQRRRRALAVVEGGGGVFDRAPLGGVHALEDAGEGVLQVAHQVDLAPFGRFRVIPPDPAIGRCRELGQERRLA